MCPSFRAEEVVEKSGPADLSSAGPLLPLAAPLALPARRYRVSYRSAEGGRGRLPLAAAAHLPLHEFEPVRSYAAHRRQRHMSGMYWFATTRRHVGYESRLELAILTMLDFDPVVEAVAAQPFRLHVELDGGRQLEHVPDYAVLSSSGQSGVVDVTPSAWRDRPERQQTFELTARACELAGWQYTVESEPDATVLANVVALAGFRREPVALDSFGDALLDVARRPIAIGRLADAVGPRMLVRPVIFHLLWKRLLIAELSARLREDTLVAVAGTAGDDA